MTFAISILKFFFRKKIFLGRSCVILEPEKIARMLKISTFLDELDNFNFVYD